MMGFFKDDLGNFSSYRLMTVFLVGVVLVNWTYIVWTTKTWIPLDVGTLGVLASALTGKVAQKYIEDKPFEFAVPSGEHGD